MLTYAFIESRSTAIWEWLYNTSFMVRLRSKWKTTSRYLSIISHQNCAVGILILLSTTCLIVEQMTLKLKNRFREIIYHTIYILYMANCSFWYITSSLLFYNVSEGTQYPRLEEFSHMWKYLEATKYLFLTLKTSGIQVIQWYVDVDFSVHHDMRSHNDIMMNLGKYCVYGSPGK